MGLKGRLNRLRSRMAGQAGYLEMADGSRHFYQTKDAHAAVFLSQLAVGCAGHREKRVVELPELVKAVALATPEARRGFVETYGDPFRGPSIVGEGRAWVRHQWCTLDGELQTELLKGSEAQDYPREIPDLSEP